MFGPQSIIFCIFNWNSLQSAPTYKQDFSHYIQNACCKIFPAARRQEPPLTSTRTYFIARCTAIGETEGTISDSLYRLHCKDHYCTFYHVSQVNVELYRKGISEFFCDSPLNRLRVFENKRLYLMNQRWWNNEIICIVLGINQKYFISSKNAVDMSSA